MSKIKRLRSYLSLVSDVPTSSLTSGESSTNIAKREGDPSNEATSKTGGVHANSDEQSLRIASRVPDRKHLRS